MSKTVTQPDNLTIIFARIKAGAFMTTVGGMLMLTLASTFGHEATRTILLSLLTIVFVIGGGLLGLVSMHHISHTHLPEIEEVQADQQSLEPHPVLPPNKRARGFLGLFQSSAENPSGEASSASVRQTA